MLVCFNVAISGLHWASLQLVPLALGDFSIIHAGNALWSIAGCIAHTVQVTGKMTQAGKTFLFQVVSGMLVWVWCWSVAAGNACSPAGTQDTAHLHFTHLCHSPFLHGVSTL